MSSKRKRSSTDEWTPEKWYRDFFSDCRLPDKDAQTYSVIFADNDMHFDMLPMLNKDLLKEMSISKVGHIIEIMRAAQTASQSQEQLGLAQSVTPSTSPPLKRKVTTVKSVVNALAEKKLKTGKNNERLEKKVIKRPVPQEGPTLTVKMPQKYLKNVSPSEAEEEDNDSYQAEDSDDSSNNKVQQLNAKVSTPENHSEKKKSVFDRLGSSGTPEVAAEDSTVVAKNRSLGGILKKSPPSQEANTSEYYGPYELPRSSLPLDESRRMTTSALVSYGDVRMSDSPPPPRLIARASPVRVSPQQSSHFSSERQMRPAPERRSIPDNQLFSGPSTSKESGEPSFHVTMSMKLHNPLVTKVANGTKKLEDRRNLRLNSPAFRNNSSSPNEKYYGSMAADQVEMSKETRSERDMKQRLGTKAIEWNAMDGGMEKKRVSFGNVRTKEIPALPGTHPLNSISLNKRYTGSIALRTAKRIQM